MAVEARYRIENQAVNAAIRRVLGYMPIGGNGTPIFEIAGRVVKTDTQLRFRQQKTPDGVPWQPSQRVLRDGGQTLRLTGRLRNSITSFASHASVEIGTNVVYARIQQEGGSTGRKNPKTGKQPVIPPRPFLGLSAAGGEELIAAVNDFLARKWGR